MSMSIKLQNIQSHTYKVSRWPFELLVCQVIKVKIYVLFNILAKNDEMHSSCSGSRNSQIFTMGVWNYTSTFVSGLNYNDNFMLVDHGRRSSIMDNLGSMNLMAVAWVSHLNWVVPLSLNEETNYNATWRWPKNKHLKFEFSKLPVVILPHWVLQNVWLTQKYTLNS